MTKDADVEQVAVGLIVSLSLLRRRTSAPDDSATDRLSPAEIAALARLEWGGPATSAEVARRERVTPQSMGVTLHALEKRHLVGRRRDAHDRRRVVFAATDAGQRRLRQPGAVEGHWLMEALSSCSPQELRQLFDAASLIERLTQTH